MPLKQNSNVKRTHQNTIMIKHTLKISKCTNVFLFAINVQPSPKNLWLFLSYFFVLQTHVTCNTSKLRTLFFSLQTYNL